MVKVRKEQLERAKSKITDNNKDLHISGEPGIGKSEFLSHLQDELATNYTIDTQTVRLHHSRDDLERDLLHRTRRNAKNRDSLPNQSTGASGGAGPVSGGVQLDDRVRDLHKLEDLTEDWSGDPFLLCVDDIHKIDDNKKIVREIIDEISAALGDQIQLVTAGQIGGVSGVTDVEEIHLNLYTEEETRLFLQETVGDLSPDTVRNVHTGVEGHPLYLSLLTASSEDEKDLRLPEDEVYDTIEHRYIEALPHDTVTFLRQVAPLPELNEKTCSGIIDGLSEAEAARKLRELNRRVIIQQVNRTDDQDSIYKIHERFRNFLVQKNRNNDEINRTAFQYHIQEVVTNFKEGGDRQEPMKISLPHFFHLRQHLKNLYGDEAGPEAFIKEIEQMSLSYPERGIVIIHSVFGVFPTDPATLWQLEYDTFSDWVYEICDNEYQAELIVQLVEWGLSQFDDDSMDLTDVRVDGSLDELPVDSQPMNDLNLAEEHVERLRRIGRNILCFFLIEEPYRSKTHQQQVIHLLDTYGISIDVALTFKNRIKTILRNSELGDQFEALFEEYTATVGKEFEDSLNSSLDYYELRDQSMQLGEELFENLHYEVFLHSGLLKEIAIEGGKILEEAENPGFAMLWYGLFTSYFGDNNPDSSAFNQLKELYIEQLEDRHMYEMSIENPVINAVKSVENMEFIDLDDHQVELP